MIRLPLFSKDEAFPVTGIDSMKADPIIKTELVGVDKFPRRMFDLLRITDIEKGVKAKSEETRYERSMSRRIVFLRPEIDAWLDEEQIFCQFYMSRKRHTVFGGGNLYYKEQDNVEQEIGLTFSNEADAVKFALRWL